MPLVDCPECRARISDLAPVCPRCGVPLARTSAAKAPGAPTPAVSAAAGAPVPLPFGSAVAPEETTLWEGTPSLKAMVTRIAGTALFVLLVTVVAYVGLPRLLDLAAGISHDVRKTVEANRHDIGVVALLFVLAVVGVRLGRLGWQIAVLKTQRYRVTNQRLLIESGVLSRSIEEIDMRTVEDLAFHQSLLERMLGIGTVVVLASSDRTAARHPLLGLSRPRELRELIRNSAYLATRGQLFTRET